MIYGTGNQPFKDWRCSCLNQAAGFFSKAALNGDININHSDNLPAAQFDVLMADSRNAQFFGCRWWIVQVTSNHFFIVSWFFIVTAALSLLRCVLCCSWKSQAGWFKSYCGALNSLKPIVDPMALSLEWTIYVIYSYAHYKKIIFL